MSGSGRGTLLRALLGLGLGLGAAACCWLYRRLFPQKQLPGRDRPLQAPFGPAMSRRPEDDDLVNPASNLEAEHLQKLLELLKTTDQPSIREQALVTLSNSAAFSVNQDIIRNLGGLLIIGNMLTDSIPELKVKALNALNNLSMNIQNQEQIKVYVAKICTEIDESPLNSELQLAALRVLTNMSVTNDYQDMMVNSIPCFLHLLSLGNENTQIHVLKVLVNLSANPSVTRDLLSARAPSSLDSFFGRCENKDILLRALTFVANLNENMLSEDGTEGHHQYCEGSLFSLLFGDAKQHLQKLAFFLQHQDVDVKRQIARIVTKQQS